MIPIKWKVVDAGRLQGYPGEGVLLQAVLAQEDGRAVAQCWLPISDCKTPYICETLERLQHEVLLYSTTGRGGQA